GTGQHRQLVEYDRDVLDEAAVRKRFIRVDPDHLKVEVLEDALVGGVLGDRARVVDRLALEEGQLAPGEGGGDAPRDGDVTSASRLGHGRGRLCLSSWPG